MPEKVRVASIGVGWWARVLADAAAESGEIEVVSCFSRTPEKRNAFAADHGCPAASSLEEVLGDPQVQGVLIATSHKTHRDLIEAAAEAGKPVFVEKPLAPDVDEARAAVDAAGKAGIALQVGHQRRRTAANRRIRQMIDEGRIGDIQLLEAHHCVPNGFKMAQEAWRWDPEESPLGAMTSLGIHKIDTFQYFAGPIARVFTFTRPGRDVSIDEATALGFEFESGAVGTLVTSFFTPRLSRLSVHGTDGAAYMEADGARLSFQGREDAGRTEIELSPVDPIVDELREFARVVRGEATPEVGGEEGLEVVAVLAAAVASAETGRAQEIADFRR